MQTHWDAIGTHSFGFGLVGSGGASFPGDGDSFPGIGGESGIMLAGAEAVIATSVMGSDCGSGGGGGGSVVSFGKLGGDGGFGS